MPGTALTYLAAVVDKAIVVVGVEGIVVVGAIVVAGATVVVAATVVVVVVADVVGRGRATEMLAEPTRSKLDHDVNGTPATLFVPSVQLVME